MTVTATRQQLLAFPFEKSGRALAEIVLPASPTDHDTYLAQFLRAYFDYWYRRQHNPYGSVAELAEVPATCVLTIAGAAPSKPGVPRVVLSHSGKYAAMWSIDDKQTSRLQRGTGARQSSRNAAAAATRARV